MNLIHMKNVYKAQVIKRPSKYIRSPYVGDIYLIDESIETTKGTDEELNEEGEYLCHTPSLGCCGLSDTNSKILVSDLRDNVKTKSHFRAEASIHNEEDKNASVIVGINPKIGENIVEECIKHDLIKDIEIKIYKREQTVGNSRFDFVGKTKDNTVCIIEVKTVPLANYVDMEEKELKRELKNGTIDYGTYDFNDKVSYFPVGYRKKKGDVVSERALKHIQELEKIKMKFGDDVRTILLYVIQRNDSSKFTTSVIDPIYKEAVKKASINGVEIKTIQVEWKYNENDKELFCSFVRNDLPIEL